MITVTSVCKGHFYWRKLGLMALLMTAMTMGSPLTSSACTYVDPQVSPSGYRKWCDCIGGDYYERPYRCVPKRGGGGASSMRLSPAEQMLRKGMEQFFHDLFWGSDLPNERQRAREELEREDENTN